MQRTTSGRETNLSHVEWKVGWREQPWRSKAREMVKIESRQALETLMG